jgi:hypothetical protein
MDYRSHLFMTLAEPVGPTVRVQKLLKVFLAPAADRVSLYRLRLVRTQRQCICQVRDDRSRTHGLHQPGVFQSGQFKRVT